MNAPKTILAAAIAALITTPTYAEFISIPVEPPSEEPQTPEPPPSSSGGSDVNIGAILGLAVVVGTIYYLTRDEDEPENCPRITVQSYLGEKAVIDIPPADC